MSEAQNTYNPFLYSGIAIILWLAVVFAVLGFIWLSDKKQAKPSDVQARVWRRLQYAHAELLPLMDTQEKKQMVELVNTTIANAELFKNMKPGEVEKLGRKRVIRESGKKVEFRI